MKKIKNKWLKALAIVILAIMGTSLIFPLIISLALNQKIQKVTQETNNFFQKFPQNETNDTAKNLDIMLISLGLLPVTNQNLRSEDRLQPEIENLINPITSFLETSLESVKINPQPLPEKLQNFLNQNQDQIREIRDYILASDQPTWNYPLTETFTDPINYQTPQLSGIFTLQKIFILDILANQDNPEEINKTLEASLKLNQATQKQPGLVSQIVSIIVGQYQAGIFRQVENLNSQWQEKLAQYSYNYQQGILDALYIEAISIGSPFLLESSSNNLIFDWFGKPYLQLLSLDTGVRMKQAFNKLENQNICQFDIEQVNQELQQSGWWNLLGIPLPNFGNQWLKGGGVMLDWELTGKVLEIRAIKEKTGQYPDRLSSLDSQVCPNQQWTYQKEDDQVTLNFSQKLDWKIPETEDNTLILPLTFVQNMLK
jgi:hypothetical protein